VPDSKDVEYLLGLLAGEGCFLAELSYNTDKYKFNVAVTPACKIQMVEGDRPMLEYIRDTFNIGTIHTDSGSGMAIWKVYKDDEMRELNQIIWEADSPHFTRSKKWDSYLKWREIVQQKAGYGHFESEDEVKRLVRLAKNINDGNRGYSTEKWISRVEGNATN